MLSNSNDITNCTCYYNILRLTSLVKVEGIRRPDTGKTNSLTKIVLSVIGYAIKRLVVSSIYLAYRSVKMYDTLMSLKDHKGCI